MEPINEIEHEDGPAVGYLSLASMLIMPPLPPVTQCGRMVIDGRPVKPAIPPAPKVRRAPTKRPPSPGSKAFVKYRMAMAGKGAIKTGEVQLALSLTNSPRRALKFLEQFNYVTSNDHHSTWEWIA